MTKLYTFGDSNTWGIGLLDIWDAEKNFYLLKKTSNKDSVLHDQVFYGPSKHAWPQILADKLKIECINKSIPGASNKEIWLEIINNLDNFKLDDIVIIAWSFFNRTCFLFNDENQIKKLKLGIWFTNKNFFTIYNDDDKLKKKLGTSYYKNFHSDIDQYYDFYLRCNHIESLLCDKVHLLTQAGSDSLNYDKERSCKFNNVNLIKCILDKSFFVDKGEDRNITDDALGGHPGVKSHENYANYIENILC